MRDELEVGSLGLQLLVFYVLKLHPVVLVHFRYLEVEMQMSKSKFVNLDNSWILLECQVGSNLHLAGFEAYMLVLRTQR